MTPGMEHADLEQKWDCPESPPAEFLTPMSIARSIARRVHER
jgi:hypothetical protein